jgi:hypothetical protein
VEAEDFPEGVDKTIFLAVTPCSITSLKAIPEGVSHMELPGDFRPFVHAVETNFDPDKGVTPNPASASTSAAAAEDNAASPKYNGSMLIPLHLIFSDLYAVTRPLGPTVDMKDLWALGKRHPWGVYSGPTTGVRRRDWREMTLTSFSTEVKQAVEEWNQKQEESASESEEEGSTDGEGAESEAGSK